MSLPNVVRTAENATIIRALDGTATPLDCTVRFSRGDIKLSNVSDNGRETIHVQSRGKTISVEQGARKPPGLSFTVIPTELSSATLDHLTDFIHGVNQFSSRVRTSSVNGTAFCCTIELEDEAGDVVRLEGCSDWTQSLFEESGEGNNQPWTCTVYGAVKWRPSGVSAGGAGEITLIASTVAAAAV